MECVRNACNFGTLVLRPVRPGVIWSVSSPPPPRYLGSLVSLRIASADIRPRQGRPLQCGVCDLYAQAAFPKDSGVPNRDDAARGAQQRCQSQPHPGSPRLFAVLETPGTARSQDRAAEVVGLLQHGVSGHMDDPAWSPPPNQKKQGRPLQSNAALLRGSEPVVSIEPLAADASKCVVMQKVGIRA